MEFVSGTMVVIKKEKDNFSVIVTMVAKRKKYILRIKAQGLKNLTILHFVTTFHDFSRKIETGWFTRVAKLILKTRNANVKNLMKHVEDANW